jgi:hypothetical protein
VLVEAHLELGLDELKLGVNLEDAACEPSFADAEASSESANHLQGRNALAAFDA